MKNYILKRLILTIPVIFGVVTIVFFLIHIVPGDPIDILLGENAIQSDRELLRHELGLDKPVMTQYASYLVNVFKFDFGRSVVTGRPVMETLSTRYPNTIILALFALCVSIIVSFTLGTIAAIKKYSLLDNSSMFLSLLAVSMPPFWLGPLLILLFSIKLDLLPVSGKEGFLSIILPAATLGMAFAAITSRMVRSSLLEVLNDDYIKTARAKGLSEFVVIIKHALRNALIPVVTIIGLQFGILLAGSIITETIFAWPGLGSELISSIQKRDYPMVQACVLCISFTYVFVNLATDLLYSVIDPRVRYN